MSTQKDPLENLLDTSSTRLQRVLEIAQYSMIYFVIALTFGSIIEKIFPRDTMETAIHRSTFSLVTLIILQIGVDAITIFYIHKIAVLLPFFFQLSEDYQPHSKETQSMAGIVAIAVAFIGMQPGLSQRIRELARRLDGIPHLLNF